MTQTLNLVDAINSLLKVHIPLLVERMYYYFYWWKRMQGFF